MVTDILFGSEDTGTAADLGRRKLGLCTGHCILGTPQLVSMCSCQGLCLRLAALLSLTATRKAKLRAGLWLRTQSNISLYGESLGAEVLKASPPSEVA